MSQIVSSTGRSRPAITSALSAGAAGLLWCGVVAAAVTSPTHGPRFGRTSSPGSEGVPWWGTAGVALVAAVRSSQAVARRPRRPRRAFSFGW